MDFGFEKIMEFAMKIDKLNMVGKVMDKITKRLPKTIFKAWNNGNRDPGWGVAEIQKMSPPTTVGNIADMQLCVIKQGSPPVLGDVAFIVTDLLTLAKCAVCILVR